MTINNLYYLSLLSSFYIKSGFLFCFDEIFTIFAPDINHLNRIDYEKQDFTF